jgi:hypothetical protein
LHFHAAFADLRHRFLKNKAKKKGDYLKLSNPDARAQSEV